jgi:hypothetical protein
MSRAGALVLGITPLGPVALAVLLAVLLAALARQLTAGQGFFAQQWAAGIVVVLGLVGAAVSYVVFSVRALRQVRRWQQAGQSAPANAALWGLVITALVVLLPLILAIVIPQHPAPNLAP